MPSWKSHNTDLRQASHAGSWYTQNAEDLNAELSTWLDAVKPSDLEDPPYPVKRCKAIIAPHAGYSYSGPAAAWAYRAIDTSGIKRVFVLGPSHHLYIQGCALSRCKEFQTPIGNLPLDLETIQELRNTGKFSDLSLADDEAEHSIEMHLPYIRKVFEGQDIHIVPILVGAITPQSESLFGDILASYLASLDTIFVVSSDFCHWGTRFSYTYYLPKSPPSDAPAIHLSRKTTPSATHPIHESIRVLDHQAMEILTLPSPPDGAAETHTKFADYLSATKNTICGRHPIGVLLGALASLERRETAKESATTIKWVRYEQSSACLTVQDSSVSYASAWVRL